jgi:LmbE family N-acetylglucosaminyl deacetylase
MNRVICVAPHPDDEILGCGATIAKHVEQLDEVFVIIATNASIGAPELFSSDSINKTRLEATDAHKFLGVEKTFFLDFPAPALNAYPEYKISLKFVEIFRKIQPTHLYLPHPGDLHQDHKAVYRAGIVAARPLDNFLIRSIYTYETLSETEWAPMNEIGFRPNRFVNISNFLDKKIEAMRYFKSQLKEFPNTRSIESIRALARFRGGTIGVNYAEAFHVEREIIL